MKERPVGLLLHTFTPNDAEEAQGIPKPPANAQLVQECMDWVPCVEVSVPAMIAAVRKSEQKEGSIIVSEALAEVMTRQTVSRVSQCRSLREIISFIFFFISQC